MRFKGEGRQDNVFFCPQQSKGVAVAGVAGLMVENLMWVMG